ESIARNEAQDRQRENEYREIISPFHNDSFERCTMQNPGSLYLVRKEKDSAARILALENTECRRLCWFELIKRRGLTKKCRTIFIPETPELSRFLHPNC